VDLPGVARALGYKAVFSVEDKDALSVILSKAKDLVGPVFIEVRVKKGNRKDLGRPSTTPIQNKEALMHFLKK
jgi:phosphonopyruvate decarboxylase